MFKIKLIHVFKPIFGISLIALLFTSCASKQDIVYFNDSQDFETLVGDNLSAYKFKVNDLVSINVSTLDPEASIPFNLFRGGMVGNNNGIQPQQLDYIVNKDGNINFPVIGDVKILGLTPQEAQALLKEKLAPYLKDPIINMRLTNFTITVLGQVARPGTYPVNGEQITIFQALGLAGDLDIRGLRKNVMVIRDFNGTKVVNKIDLTSKEVLNSPVYYLTQNDVVYVEPNNSAIKTSNLDNRAGIAVSIASLLITSTILLITRN
jgi:polysaccharide export outer membrane protein